MKIIPLSEGAFSIDKSKIFVPFNKQEDDLQQRATGSLLVEVQPFIVITNKDVILIDTGLGFFNADGTLQLHQNLIDHDINPMDVTKVLLSHLHKDHAGAIILSDPHSQQKHLSFPNAVYYVNKQELNYAIETGRPSYYPEEFSFLKDSSNVILIEDSGLIDEYIRYETTGAHSKYHMVFWIEEAGETLFFGADDAPQLQQMKSRFVAKYDYDGKKCMELRTKWWQEGQEKGWTFLFYHDIKTPTISW
jgi:glyoxylase-like metal-dependent hydrolase (beta-lactamase superfamily II)